MTITLKVIVLSLIFVFYLFLIVYNMSAFKEGMDSVPVITDASKIAVNPTPPSSTPENSNNMALAMAVPPVTPPVAPVAPAVAPVAPVAPAIAPVAPAVATTPMVTNPYAIPAVAPTVAPTVAPVAPVPATTPMVTNPYAMPAPAMPTSAMPTTATVSAK